METIVTAYDGELKKNTLPLMELKTVDAADSRLLAIFSWLKHDKILSIGYQHGLLLPAKAFH